MYRVICLLIGYLCGNFLTAELVARRVSGQSAFVQGSGNPGMANILHLHGLRAGGLVLAGDLVKTFLPCLLCRLLLFPGIGAAAAAWAGLGAVLGHDFPVWHRFHGGKGVACTCAALICVSPAWGAAACLAGLLGVLLSRYLSVGAVLIPAVFLLPAFLVIGHGTGLLTVILTLLMFQRNLRSLKNIPTGTEPKTELLKSRKNG